MSRTIEKEFATRASADLAVERLVQEHGFERTDIFITSQGRENSAGSEISGGDAGTIGEDERDDAPLETPVLVSVDLNDEQREAIVEATFREFEGR